MKLTAAAIRTLIKQNPSLSKEEIKRIIEAEVEVATPVEPKIVPNKDSTSTRINSLPLVACSARGDYNGESRPCKSCGGTVTVALRSCSLYGKCSEAKVVTEEDGTPIKCCRICTTPQQ